MNNVLELKIVNELNPYSFFIPSYQRGYKWTPKEVIDLLNDINEFTPRMIDSTNEKTWYCLQPIVIKNRNGADYEVIDGQQRLTTIYLILYYLNQDFVENKRDRLFSLDYETRTNTKIFLEKIEDEKNYENIDFYHINEAFKAISEWFDKQDSRFDKGEFRSKLKYNSKIIWYESTEEDSISIFTRINIGKIPLTNAELIKALFLNSSNFDKEQIDKLRLKQLEIASEWDNIENSLQDDRFWYFLTGNEVSTNRIEFIFNIMNEENDETDTYSTFRYFNNKFKIKSQSNIEKNWKEVKDYFQRFNEWFSERDLYHKIGYLICTEQTTIKELYITSNKSSKSSFKNYLDVLIKNGVSGVQLDNLQYGDKHVRNILLLYNILTMLNNEKDNSRFPFDLYKNESWDIEHITSVKDSLPDKNRDAWLKDAIVFIDSEKEDAEQLIKRAKECDTSNDTQFKSVFEDIVLHFNSEIDDEDINDISNLSLLDSETNRGYKNAIFPIKRKTIINRDKAGTFIPLCTKNVFLKYFSEYPPKISFWTQDDRNKYEEDLYNVLHNFISSGDSNG
ncbi:DUF262 domain-containing protein [Sphaerochaeta halotolerans]|uniref:DUF262 domain-containing protein n=1 Tax=Sphaerochaeta halotolerans TaxID=2293840 RepID=A0A372MH26_9SPIR|nr:DUF262 domain-containing protein [Sphaerochaeta halotolerans]RFU95062.1 DUF262 domain-containing protein [Sphaerochaeta halotolerans]